MANVNLGINDFIRAQFNRCKGHKVPQCPLPLGSFTTAWYQGLHVRKCEGVCVPVPAWVHCGHDASFSRCPWATLPYLAGGHGTAQVHTKDRSAQGCPSFCSCRSLLNQAVLAMTSAWPCSLGGWGPEFSRGKPEGTHMYMSQHGVCAWGGTGHTPVHTPAQHECAHTPSSHPSAPSPRALIATSCKEKPQTPVNAAEDV